MTDDELEDRLLLLGFEKRGFVNQLHYTSWSTPETWYWPCANSWMIMLHREQGGWVWRTGPPVFVPYSLNHLTMRSPQMAWDQVIHTIQQIRRPKA